MELTASFLCIKHKNLGSPFGISRPRLEECMKAQLQVTKNSALLHSGVYNIDNADDFGKACADVWFALRERQLNNESSIGALMEHLDRGVFDLLAGAQIVVSSIG